MEKFDYASLRPRRQPCALCGSLSLVRLTSQDRHLLGIETEGCNGCGLLQTNPRPDERSLANFYAEHYRLLYQGIRTPGSSYVARYRKDARTLYTASFLLEATKLTERDVVLDFGCGEGSLFLALRKKGFRGRMLGIEADSEFGAYASSSSDAKVFRSLDEVKNEKAQLVVLNHVLEHYPKPVELLQRLGSLLNPGGSLYVDVPDAEQYRGIQDLHLAHLLHFDRSTLALTLNAAGFKPAFIEAHSPPNHPPSLRSISCQSAVRFDLRADTTATDRTWRVMRRLERRTWRWKLRERVARLPGAVWAYRHLKRVALHATGKEAGRR
jgi:2-polyprenyl-3-methyl-5-hydroxy-6-metoxy-1,4-benzoquinol methylase